MHTAAKPQLQHPLPCVGFLQAHSAGMSAASISSLLSSGLASTQRGVSIVAVDAPAAQPCTATHLAAGVTALQGATGSWATPAGAQLGRIVYCNDSFAAMCGRSSKDLVGSSFEVVIGPDTDPEQVRTGLGSSGGWESACWGRTPQIQEGAGVACSTAMTAVHQTKATGSSSKHCAPIAAALAWRLSAGRATA